MTEPRRSLDVVVNSRRCVPFDPRAAERRSCVVEATAGDYDHLLRTVMKYLDVE